MAGLAAWVGDVPPAYLEAIEKHSIKIKKPEIDHLFEEAKKRNLLQKETIADLRRICKTNLFFYAKYVAGNPDMTDAPIEGFEVKSTHGDVCEFYIVKDETKEIAEQDSIFKERLLLFPRGSFKSRINMADTLQWVLNFPNVRILLLTSTRKLSILFLDEIKERFVIKEDATLMNQLFPEFCLKETELGNADSFYSPMRTKNDKEPTVYASSVESALSGFHWDIMKCSDIISNENSGTEEQLQKATRNFYLNKKMLMQYGYLDVDGTRYHDLDTYGDMIEKNEKTPESERRLKLICQPAWRPKPGFEGKEITDLTREQCYLLFDHPNFLNFENLRHDYRLDEVVHEGQMQQNPRPQITTVFPRELLVSKTVPFTKLPWGGPISITWDFAFSKKKGRDYTAGAVGQYDKDGRLYIIDMVFGRFKPNELAQAVVKLAKDWNPQIIGIEDVAGSRFLEPAILAEASRQNIPNIRIDWFTPSQEKDAKKTRMAALHPWLVNDRLFFANTLSSLEALYKQFEMCLGSHHHEDIPDVIAHQLRYAPRMLTMIQNKEINTMSVDDAEWNLYFEEGTDQWGRIGMGTPPPAKAEELNEDLKAEPAAPEYEHMLGAGLSG